MATIELADILSMIGIVLKVAIGLGAVIFVHELGHFLVAKACGVKCEKFMIGFDIGGYKLAWRRGETLYGIGILPLGGYVKMLGQDDDPAHIKEQMQKSQVDERSANAKAIKGPDGETYYVDRRSYLAKSVPQRMAIISAGVVMNVIFAFIFAVIAYGMGVPYVPAVVSEVTPGSPAFEANIRPGDEIEQIGSQRNPTFMQLKSGVTLGDLEKGIELRVRKASDGEVVTIPLKPRQRDGKLATIGIGPPWSLTLSGKPPVIDDSPAASAKIVAPADGKVTGDEAKLMDGDEIVRVGDIAVKAYPEFSALLAQHADKPLQITVRREMKKKGAATNDKKPETQELTFEVPPQRLNRFNFSMKMGPITAVRTGSPAAEAGIVAGDLIEAVDGKKLGEGAPAAERWDAETLPEYLRRAAAAGRDIEMTVLRRTAEGEDRETKVRIKPELPTMMNLVFPARSPGTPMAATEIGVSYQIQNQVAAVQPNSQAAAKIAAGDKILRAKVIFPKDKDGKTPDPILIKFVPDEPGLFGRAWQTVFGGGPAVREYLDWPRLIDALQFVPAGTEAELTFRRGDAEPFEVTLSPVADEDAFVATRGFWFKPVEQIRTASSFGEQVRYGWDETTEALSMVFRFLKKIGTQVPISALGGPVTIAKAAGYSAAEGVSSLLIFLTMLSANLAVLNLLPIPLLDGGHLVFLAYEGVRGRPANEKFVVALHTAGFVFIVSLMLYVLALDLNLIPRNL